MLPVDRALLRLTSERFLQALHFEESSPIFVVNWNRSSASCLCHMNRNIDTKDDRYPSHSMFLNDSRVPMEGRPSQRFWSKG